MSEKNKINVPLWKEARFILCVSFIFAFVYRGILTMIYFILKSSLNPKSYYFFLITGIAGFIILSLIARFFMKIRFNGGRNLFSHTDNGKKNFIKYFLYTLKLMTLVSFITFIIYLLYYSVFPYKIDSFSRYASEQGEGFGAFASIIYLLGLIICALRKEMFIRYVLYDLIKKVRPDNSKPIFLITTSLAASLYHLSPIVDLIPRFLAVFIFSFSMGLIYLKTNNLIYPVIVHFLSNSFTTFSVIHIFFDTSGVLSKYGGFIGGTILVGLNIFICFLLLLLLTCFFYLIKNKKSLN